MQTTLSKNDLLDDRGGRPGTLRVVHTGYRVSDMEKAQAFYEALGFEEYIRMPMGDADQNDIGLVVFFALPNDGPRLELQQLYHENKPEVGTAWSHLGVTVDDLDRTLSHLATHGIKPALGPFQPVKDGARICFLRDPDGHLVELLANLNL